METTITKKSIYYNVELLKWYFTRGKAITSEEEKQKAFSILSYSVLEDPYIFMRIMLYVANARRSDEEELSFKLLVIFIGTMFPEMAMANLDLFMKLGKKDDILYFIQCPNIAPRVIKYIKHKAKMDEEFNILLNGEVIGIPIDRQVRYKPKMKLKNHRWDIFLFKILDDALFNGITLGTPIEETEVED
jgi:hypothetical protein